NVDGLYSEISREPVNSSFSLVNGEVVITPHVMGVYVDKALLASAAAELVKTEDSETVVPVSTTQPAITFEMAKEKLFSDTLATYRTHFSTSTVNDQNRSENIKLAVAKIDGKILLPGEEFSFNDTVGPRSEDGGYKTAHTYVAGKVVDGIGGGICQVSSTLYNAVLKADLSVVERRNHMFTVGYVPYGQDATVSFGTTDFRFKNSTNWPLKLSASVSKNNYVSFTFTGTNETPGKKVIMTQQILKKIPFKTKYIDDPTLASGKTSVKQEGKEGLVVDVFKTVKVGNTVISQGKLYTNSYNPITEEIRKGTKAVAASEASTAATPAPVAEPAASVPASPAPAAQPSSVAAPQAESSPAPEATGSQVPIQTSDAVATPVVE
ncbi:MAG: vanomycin resistance protein VanB, partial [Clostridiales bacterium]|nr:vanomycin resistance protein VanB [Clostridiales bacterium]